MLSAAIVCLLAQQIDQSALEKAMAADAAAKAATAPASTPASAPAASAGTWTPEATPAPEAAAAETTAGGGAWAAQQGARAPGGSLLNPALSFILDGSFGYYGAHTGDFLALGLPPAGDDPSVIRQGFGLQESSWPRSRRSIPTSKGQSSSPSPTSKVWRSRRRTSSPPLCRSTCRSRRGPSAQSSAATTVSTCTCSSSPGARS